MFNARVFCTKSGEQLLIRYLLAYSWKNDLLLAARLRNINNPLGSYRAHEIQSNTFASRVEIKSAHF